MTVFLPQRTKVSLRVGSIPLREREARILVILKSFSYSKSKSSVCLHTTYNEAFEHNPHN